MDKLVMLQDYVYYVYQSTHVMYGLTSGDKNINLQKKEKNIAYTYLFPKFLWLFFDMTDFKK